MSARRCITCGHLLRCCDLCGNQPPENVSIETVAGWVQAVDRAARWRSRPAPTFVIPRKARRA